jgi:pyruvate formate lyase activating enzyme
MCMACADACLSVALELKGKRMTQGEIIEEVEKDEIFYRTSDGGITFSGGEPLLQHEFAAALGKELRRRYYSVAIETTGYAKYEHLLSVVEHCDAVMYDLKFMDTKAHKQYTGVNNELIHENLRKIAALGKGITVRVPVIGGINSDEQNIRKTAEFVQSLGIKHLDLLPYHRLGEGKYVKLGRKHTLTAYTPSAEQMEELKKMVESYGMRVMIGG